LILAGALSTAPAHAQAPSDPVPVAVTVMRYVQLAAPDPGGNDGDYFAAVCWPNAAGAVACTVRNPTTFLVNHVKTPVAQDNAADVSPFWTLTRTFDRAEREEVVFTLLIWDRDPGVFQGGDDVMDINPRNDEVTLTFRVNLRTGAWVEVDNSIPPDRGFSEGDGDTESNPGWAGPGGEPGKLLFDISLSDDGDGDDDGIPDGVERTGVRDIDGNLVANMAGLGADPCRKTVAVEADFMETATAGHTHRPSAQVINEVIDAFDAAPVNSRPGCPYQGYGTSGVDLVVDVDDAIPEQASLSPTSINDACSTQLPAQRDNFFERDLRRYFHYSLWVHDLAPGVTNSGVQCASSPDFIVSLGSWTGSVGTVREQSGTFMHELGHALSLGHGGGDTINFKPNYLSVMNYWFATVGINNAVSGVTRLDYSQRALPALTETALLEPAGIGDAFDRTAWRDPGDTRRTGLGNVGLDWNWSTAGLPPLDPNPVAVDVNGDSVCIRFGADGASDTTPGGDDVTVGGGLRAGPNGTCESIANSAPTPPADDRNVVDTASPCVMPGGNGTLDTTRDPADSLGSALEVPIIVIGGNGTCQSAATGDDVQATPVGQTVPTIALSGLDDWQSLRYATGLGQIASSSSGMPVDITLEEAREVQRFWTDALTAPTASLTAPASLTGAVTAAFSEPVLGVTDTNFVIRVAGTAAPLPASISCADAGGAAIGCGTAGVVSARLLPRTALVPGQHYEAVIGLAGAPPITDSPGNAVAPVSTTFRASTQEEETSAAAVYGWAPVRQHRARGGSYVHDDLAGASASFTMNGTAATWYTVTGPSEGIAELRVDGALYRTVNLFSVFRRYGVPIPITGLSPGSHRVTILVTGRKGRPFGGSSVAVDDVTPGDGPAEQGADVEFRWQPNTAFEDPGPVRYVRSHLRDSDVSFTFRGTGVTWYTNTGPGQGRATLYVDGIRHATVNNRAPQRQLHVPVEITGLTDAVHTLRIVVRGPRGRKFVAVDGWEVH
jgi:hypothetical protein